MIMYIYIYTYIQSYPTIIPSIIATYIAQNLPRFVLEHQNYWPQNDPEMLRIPYLDIEVIPAN